MKRKATELREKTMTQLREDLTQLRRSLCKMRWQKVGDNLPKPHSMRETRRAIARINTILAQQTRQAERG